MSRHASDLKTNCEIPVVCGAPEVTRDGLRFLIEVARSMMDWFDGSVDRTGEALATLTLFLDSGIKVTTGDKRLWPVLAFRTQQTDGTEILAACRHWSDWHFYVYPLVGLMKSNPELFAGSGGGMEAAHFEEICRRPL